MIDDVMEMLTEGCDKSLEALRRELSKVRTGRAHPDILAGVRVDYYGTPTPLAQMANISVPDAQMLMVKPWENGQARAIDKAIRESSLNLNPQLDADLIRIPIPPLTEERRKEMVKMAKRSGEEGKVAIRKHRRDAMDMLADAKKEGDISEDEQDRAKKRVEEIIQGQVKRVDAIVAERESAIMEV